MNNAELFLYWMEEREKIRKAKEAGFPKPWSNNDIFQTVYFCNVRRENDKVTKWLRNNWLVDDRNYEFAMVMARLFNKPETLNAISYPYDFKRWQDIEDEIRAAALIRAKDKGPFWGNAYTVTTHGQRIDKLTYAIGVLKDAYYRLPLAGVGGTLVAAHSAFKTLEGFSDFMAGQVIADLKNSAHHPLANAPDWWTFVAPGPGSKKGLNYFFSRDPDKAINTKRFIEEMSIVEDYAGTREVLCRQDLQNCLCEYSKYVRVMEGGRTKRNYRGY